MPGELGRGSLHRSGVTGVAQPVQRGTAPARLELQPDLEGRGDRTRRTDRQRTELSAFGERDGALVDARDPGDVNLPKSASTASETEQPTDCEVVHESIMASRHCLAVTGSCTANARTQRPAAGLLRCRPRHRARRRQVAASPRRRGPAPAERAEPAETPRPAVPPPRPAAAPGPRVSVPSTIPRACRTTVACGRDPGSSRGRSGARRERPRRVRLLACPACGRVRGIAKRVKEAAAVSNPLATIRAAWGD